MKSSVFALLIWGSIALPPLLQAGGSGDRVHYVGGTIAGLPSQSEGRIQTTDAEALLFTSRGESIRVPYQNITNIEYGMKVDRRYAEAILISPLLILSKRRSHYLTVGYTDADGRQQAMVLQVAKQDVRAVLVSLEARTGRKVEFQDEEARKAGKG